MSHIDITLIHDIRHGNNGYKTYDVKEVRARVIVAFCRIGILVNQIGRISQSMELTND